MRKGFSLPELMMSIAVFSLLLVMIVLIDQSSRRATSKLSSNSDTYRMAMLAVERLHEELLHARVVETALDHLVYLQPQPLDDHVLVSAGGQPVLSTTSARLSVDAAGDLVRTVQGVTRRIAPLGAAGRITFSQAGTALLSTRVHAEQRGSIYDVSFDVLLENQQ